MKIPARFLCVLILFSLFANNIFASEAFNNAIEDSRTSENQSIKGDSSSSENKSIKKDKKSKSSKNNSVSSSDNTKTSSDEAEESLALMFIQLFACAWLHNLLVNYAPYPYCYDGYNDLVWRDSNEPADDFRLHRFVLDTGAIYLKDIGVGNVSRLDFMFLPVLGIRAENAIFYETASEQNKSGNFFISAQMPVFQTNPLSLYFDAGMSFWYGDVHEILKKTDFAYGFDFRSYPFKPIALRWRIIIQTFEDDVRVFHSNLELGIIMKQWELYGGYRYMDVGNDTEVVDTFRGFTAGLRLYF